MRAFSPKLKIYDESYCNFALLHKTRFFTRTGVGWCMMTNVCHSFYMPFTLDFLSFDHILSYQMMMRQALPGLECLGRLKKTGELRFCCELEGIFPRKSETSWICYIGVTMSCFPFFYHIYYILPSIWRYPTCFVNSCAPKPLKRTS